MIFDNSKKGVDVQGFVLIRVTLKYKNSLFPWAAERCIPQNCSYNAYTVETWYIKCSVAVFHETMLVRRAKIADK